MTTYTLFGQTGGGSLQNDGVGYTLGMEFSLSSNAVLTGIWFYSAPGADTLPSGCCVWAVVPRTIVSGTENDSPTWSGAAGSGWVKCSYNGSVTLTAATNYKVSVLKPSTSSAVYSATTHYWDGAGPGNAGLTNGIITAPNSNGSDGGQDSFAAAVSSLTYPGDSFNAANYWVDIEVSTGGSSHSATSSLTVTPGLTAHGGKGQQPHSATGSLSVTPSLHAVPAHGYRTPAAFTSVPGLMFPGYAWPGEPSVTVIREAAPLIFTLGDPQFSWLTGTAIAG